MMVWLFKSVLKMKQREKLRLKLETNTKGTFMLTHAYGDQIL